MNDATNDKEADICQKLCIQQGTDGCCFQDSEDGCQWQTGADVDNGESKPKPKSNSNGADYARRAMKCSEPGKILYFFSK